MTAEALAKDLIFQFSDRQNAEFIKMASKLSEKKLQVQIILIIFLMVFVYMKL